jgi:hypothetical protein
VINTKASETAATTTNVAAGETGLVSGLGVIGDGGTHWGDHQGILGSSPTTASNTTTPATMVTHQSRLSRPARPVEFLSSTVTDEC